VELDAAQLKEQIEKISLSTIFDRRFQASYPSIYKRERERLRKGLLPVVDEDTPYWFETLTEGLCLVAESVMRRRPDTTYEELREVVVGIAPELDGDRVLDVVLPLIHAMERMALHSTQ
jgi:hypothetical protein